MHLLNRKKERRTGRKLPRTLVCPVCKGETVVRVLPGDAVGWNESAVVGSEVIVGYVVQRCWACDGSGRLRIENRGVSVGHFSR